jgi:hypothetical protein
MVKPGNVHDILGTYVEHKGRFAMAIPYHPIERRLHHIIEFEADYAIKTECVACAEISLGSKIIETAVHENDWGGMGSCVWVVAKKIKNIASDYPGANIKIIVKIKKSFCILAPIENPDYRRRSCELPREWYLAEDKDKLEEMVSSSGFSIPAHKVPRRPEDEEEEIIVWDSNHPKDFSGIIKYASQFSIKAERLEQIIESF